MKLHSSSEVSELPHVKSYDLDFVPRKDPDQPVHPASLIRVFDVHILKRERKRLLSDYRCNHMKYMYNELV